MLSCPRNATRYSPPTTNVPRKLKAAYIINPFHFIFLKYVILKMSKSSKIHHSTILHSYSSPMFCPALCRVFGNSALSSRLKSINRS